MSASVSIIIPVHNEAPFIIKQIHLLLKQLRTHTFPYKEILIVENGSQDKSKKIIQKLAQRQPKIRFLSLSQASYGQALKAGLLSAKGKYLVIFNLDFFDIPFAHKAVQLLPYIDLVIGSKTLIVSQDRRPFLRRISTYLFNVFLRLVLNYPGTDTHGIKAFRNSPLLRRTILACRTTNELFDTELILRLTRSGALLTELPVTIQEIRPTRYSTLKRILSTASDLMTAAYSKYVNKALQVEPPLRVADDYGISPQVNTAILKAVRHREIDIISVLANYATKKNVQPLVALPPDQLSFHFNLVRGRSLLPHSKIPTLTQADGTFFPLPLFCLKFFLGFITIRDIKKEFEAQLNHLAMLKLKVKYLDSEQHTHTFSTLNSYLQSWANRHHLTVRSTRSSILYLFRKPLRLLIFFILHLLFKSKKLVFPTPAPSRQATMYHAQIFHPGTNYD